jgi:riboflavin synthase
MSAEMFTGIVEATGSLSRAGGSSEGFRATLLAPFAGLELGESVAVNGVCLTVSALVAGGFEADVSPETCRRTTLGSLPEPAAVNLERALALGDRLGGHLVSGHVDGLARVIRSERRGENLWVELRPPPELARYIAEKGSVTLDGVSLTVNRLSEGGFELMLVPHTLAVTTLRSLAPGSELNLEIDLVARYVVRFLEVTSAEARP